VLPESDRVADLCDVFVSSYVYFIYGITTLRLGSNKYNEKNYKITKKPIKPCL